MTILKRIAMGMVLALTLALPAAAQDFRKGMAAYDRGDYASAVREWRPLAAEGHADAQFNLGAMYVLGHGVPRDDVLAYRWLTLSAANGNSNAAGLRDFLAGRMLPDQLAETGSAARVPSANRAEN